VLPRLLDSLHHQMGEGLVIEIDPEKEQALRKAVVRMKVMREKIKDATKIYTNALNLAYDAVDEIHGKMYEVVHHQGTKDTP